VSKSIHIRSPQEAAEQSLIQAHDEVKRSLNAVVAGRCLYTGEARHRLLAAKARIEAHILGGTVPDDPWRLLADW
jgi:hypothetical protein